MYVIEYVFRLTNRINEGKVIAKFTNVFSDE